MSKAKRIDPIHVIIEVIVITIGIVLAYQLNGMRETNKTEEAERKSLVELRSNLSLDLIDLEANIRTHENAIAIADSLQKMDGPYKNQTGEMLFRLFRDYLFIPQTSAFESLKGKGVDLITNDSIRVNTQRLYDFYYQVLKEYESDYPANQLYHHFEWIATRYYKSFPIREKILPEPKKATTAWLNDPELEVRMSIAKYEHQYALNISKGVKKEIEALILLIEGELESKW
ncbi:MAG: hypothetical protein HRT61_08735 [Ekhidna sp.]|nr:hypothetical protein [Ekhidna sp.]